MHPFVSNKHGQREIGVDVETCIHTWKFSSAVEMCILILRDHGCWGVDVRRMGQIW